MFGETIEMDHLWNTAVRLESESERDGPRHVSYKERYSSWMSYNDFCIYRVVKIQGRPLQ